MSQILTLISLLRVQQWYKNVIIFFGVVFSLELISPSNIFVSIFGFFALCLITSAGYIRNDIIDIERDRIHPEKSKRPLASNKIKLKNANLIFIIIIGIGLTLSFYLDVLFGIIMIVLILNTEIYSRVTKNILFLDVFAIGINFVIRAISGIFLINTPISPWIVLGVFFVALFLGFSKRKSEIITLSDKSSNHRKVLKKYTKKMLDISVLVSGISILIIFTTYSLLGPFEDGKLALTIPFIAIIILRQLYLLKINHKLIQKNEFYKDKITVLCVILYSILTLILLYTDIIVI